MSAKKVGSAIPLFVGVACILVALGGAGLQLLTRDDPDEAKPKTQKRVQPVPPKAVNRQVDKGEASEQPEEPPDTAGVQKEKELSEAESRREVTRIILDRIAETPDELNMEWIAGIFQYIRDAAGLQTYLGEVLALGAQRAVAYEAAQRSSNKILPTDPDYFISLARRRIYATKLVRKGLEKECRENLALALYKEKEKKEGLEHIDERFMTSFFKGQLALYDLLYKLAVDSGEDSEPRLGQGIKVLEAFLMDRHLRVRQREELSRRKREGTEESAAPELRREDRLRMALDKHLLLLGELYLEAAEGESRDREKLQFYAEQAFAVLAMVYQRTHSDDALEGIRQVNEIQQEYLHRMARTSWKRAQLAARTGDRERANEQYFQATQHYLECMVKAVGPKKREIAEEFRQLKQELASWRAQQETSPADAEAEI